MTTCPLCAANVAHLVDHVAKACPRIERDGRVFWCACGMQFFNDARGKPDFAKHLRQHGGLQVHALRSVLTPEMPTWQTLVTQTIKDLGTWAAKEAEKQFKESSNLHKLLKKKGCVTFGAVNVEWEVKK
jgi:hypothetical protein